VEVTAREGISIRAISSNFRVVNRKLVCSPLTCHLADSVLTGKRAPAISLL